MASRPYFLPLHPQPRDVRASEALLDRIRHAAAVGVKPRNMAWAVGLTPEEFNTLFSMDPRVAASIQAGIGQAEFELADAVYQAAKLGDVKAAQWMLERTQAWQSRLEAAQTEVAEAQAGKIDLKKLSLDELQQLRALTLKAQEAAPK